MAIRPVDDTNRDFEGGELHLASCWCVGQRRVDGDLGNRGIHFPRANAQSVRERVDAWLPSATLKSYTGRTRTSLVCCLLAGTTTVGCSRPLSSSMIPRRLRGLIGTTLLACIPWTVLGVMTGFVLQLRLIPNVSVWLARPIPGGLPVAFGLAGVIIGAINGLTFAALLFATERGKNFDDVRGWRFGVWGALATALTLGVVFQSPIAAAGGGILGAIGGLGALMLARRLGRRREVEALDAAT